MTLEGAKISGWSYLLPVKLENGTNNTTKNPFCNGNSCMNESHIRSSTETQGMLVFHGVSCSIYLLERFCGRSKHHSKYLPFSNIVVASFGISDRFIFDLEKETLKKFSFDETRYTLLSLWPWALSN